MSIHVLVSGSLVNDPQLRHGTKASLATGMTRTAGDVSIIAFGADAERLLEHSKGSPLSVVGRAKLTSWTGRDGIEKHGLNVVVDQLASIKPRAPRRAKPYPASRARPRYRDEGGSVADDPVNDLFVGSPG